jgi:hypothetical protein
MEGCDTIYNNNIPCPYYANGLHLFTLNNNVFECYNAKLPIISGVNPGRYDGHYGTTNNNDISLSRNGLTVFDSLG